MCDESTANGTDAEGRERPSWYVPIQPIPPSHHKSLAEVLLDTFGDEPLDLSLERKAETEAFLNQFLIPRDSL